MRVFCLGECKWSWSTGLWTTTIVSCERNLALFPEAVRLLFLLLGGPSRGSVRGPRCGCDETRGCGGPLSG